MEPGKGIEPFSAGSKPALLTAAPARYLVCKVRLELTRPCGHQVLNLARLPFRHMHILVGRVGFEPTVFLMSRLYRPLASASLHTYPYWLQGRDSDPHITVYEAVFLPFEHPALYRPRKGAWCWKKDLNLCPADYRSAALPTELPQQMVIPAGFEPGITGLRILRPVLLDEGTMAVPTGLEPAIS